MLAPALKSEETKRQPAPASGCLLGLFDSARSRHRIGPDFGLLSRLSRPAVSGLLPPAGSRLLGRGCLLGLACRAPRHSTRQKLPYTFGCERFALGRLIAGLIQLLGHTPRRPAFRLPRLDQLKHRHGTGQLSPGAHRSRDPMFRHCPQAPVQMDLHFLARRLSPDDDSFQQQTHHPTLVGHPGLLRVPDRWQVVRTRSRSGHARPPSAVAVELSLKRA